MTPHVAAVGLDLLLPHLEELWQQTIIVSPPATAACPIYQTGNFKPLPSSASLLSVGDQSAWIPAPLEAPLYLHANHWLVMPTVRLWPTPEGPPEYLSLSAWLLDALQRWQFPLVANPGETATVLEQLRELPPIAGVPAVALMIRYALFGADRSFTLAGLRLPALPMWVRPAGATEFARKVAKSLVVTARLDGFPRSNLRAESYRIQPTQPQDWGIDPVHTPEGSDIRLTGRLGVGAVVGADRRLHFPAENGPPLSPSTARLPFAGYNDPRRLLMAANMQAHAVPLQDCEQREPCGVDLRIAYLAWQGWNHEDAWVVSESAARQLAAIQDQVCIIAIRSVEEMPELLIKEGDAVHQGQILLRRFMAAGLLCSPLELLGKLDLREGKATLPPEPEDLAPWAGEVAGIEMHDLLNDPAVPLPMSGPYRCVYRVTLRRTLPLAVGDKLANRHGHKGVVGAILPDDAMPRWRGESLEALIDPISVLNRSNWGQVHEALEKAGGEGVDAHGRSLVEPPANSTWMTQPVQAVAGVQFVMRMPQHACDKLSGSPLPPRELAPSMRCRPQRFGEMEHWALWAHGTAAPQDGSPRLSAPARKLARLLATAGYRLEQDADALVVQPWALSEDAPAPAMVFPHKEGTPAEVHDALDAVAPDSLIVLKFDPPVCDVLVAGWEEAPREDEEPGKKKYQRRKIDVAWLPILPGCDRPPSARLDGSEEMHELTRALRWVVKALRARPSPSPPAPLPPSAGEGSSEAEDELRWAVHSLMERSLALAIGVRATGIDSSKMALLRRGVLGRRLQRSARATATPAGNLGLELDEIGVPPALAWTLFGPKLPTDLEELAAAVNGKHVWLKRDPVLHRWGLLKVRVRLVPGDTVRLPASLLGPLGADFDGDTVALFAYLPGQVNYPVACSPIELARHPLLDKPMFLPGKQYLYGLHLLHHDAARRQRLNEVLEWEIGTREWPQAESASQALQQWVLAAGGSFGCGWAAIEAHALAALGSDPGMGFGLLSVAELAALDVVRCGAAKNLYQDPRDQEVMSRLLAGQGLTIYRQGAEASDPIADVMAAAKASIGRFGGALRRLVYSACPPLQAGTVEQAQALTEQVTQKALSVKGGKPPISYGEYERQLRRLLRGEAWDESVAGELRGLLEPLRNVWDKLRLALAGEPSAWLEWLRQPHLLPDLLEREGTLRLPLHDLRLQCWLEE